MAAPEPRPSRFSGRWLRPLLAGTVLLGSIGSCELPKPQIPSIGMAPAAPVVARAATAAAPVALAPAVPAAAAPVALAPAVPAAAAPAAPTP